MNLSPYAEADRFEAALAASGAVCSAVGVRHLAWTTRAARHQYIPALREITRLARPGEKVLDWGSGYGLFSCALLELGYSVTAYDFFDDMPTFDLVHRSGDWTYVPGSEEKVALPFPDATFDVATSIGVLEHVSVTGGEEVGALRELRRVLKHDGALVISHLPNKYSLIELAARRLSRGHTFRYSLRDLKALLAEGGFELERTWRQGMVPRNSLSRFPRAAGSESFSRAVDRLDALLTAIAGPLSQNWGAIVRPV